jgi:hypothetical protein
LATAVRAWPARHGKAFHYTSLGRRSHDDRCGGSVEAPMNPHTNYFWTNASIALDGRERVTGSSATIYRPGSGLTAPSQCSFRFKTP